MIITDEVRIGDTIFLDDKRYEIMAFVEVDGYIGVNLLQRVSWTPELLEQFERGTFQADDRDVRLRDLRDCNMLKLVS